MKFVEAALSTLILTFAVAGQNTAFAAAQPPSDASIRELMELMQVKEQNNEELARIRQSIDMQYLMQKMDAGPDKRKIKILDDEETKMVALLAQDMAWRNMEAGYIQVFKETSLSQADMDGAIAFYKSSAGRHILASMPSIRENLKDVINAHLLALTAKFEKIKQDGEKKMDAIDDRKK